MLTLKEQIVLNGRLEEAKENGDDHNASNSTDR